MREELYLKDFIERSTLERLQLKRMQEMLERVAARVPFYRESFAKYGVKPSDLRTLADLRRFPFTVKTDLRDHYPFGLFATDLSEVVRVHASSGTTGKPTVVGYTREDIDIWSEVMCRTFQCVGLTAADVVQNAYGYGLFTGGLGAHYGLERLGCTVIPMSGGQTEKQLMVMKDFGVTAIGCTPSYFLFLAEQAAAWDSGSRPELESFLSSPALSELSVREQRLALGRLAEAVPQGPDAVLPLLR